MIYPLVHETDPILFKTVDEFIFDGSIDAVDLKKNLIETMIHHDGFGLAANQCGLPHRVFVLHDTEKNPFAAFNPIIIRSSGETEMNEGCLSFPKLILKIKRANTVLLQAQNEFGELYEKEFTGYHAVGVLHETDHLNGITFAKRVSRLKLEQARKRR